MYPHWQYFLSLDQDFHRLSRFIEIVPQNYGTYSIELVRILLAACSEIDVVAKAMYQPSKSRPSIVTHRNGILPRYPNLPQLKVFVPNQGLEFHPWDDWSSGEDPPRWWNEHNKIKHRRSDHFQRANLENSLLAVSGLLVLVAYLYRDALKEGQLSPEPEFFALSPEYSVQLIRTNITPLP